MINNINTYAPNRYYYAPKKPQVAYQPHFEGNVFLAKGEQSTRSIEFLFRRIVNKVTDIFETKEMKKLGQEILDTDENSSEFIDKLILAGRRYSSKKEVEINLENGIIERIADGGKSHIFIMNHDKQSSDPEMMMFFNTLLCQEYKKQGIAKTCPRPRIIMNEDILLAMNPEKRKVYKKLGAVGVDADIFPIDRRRNVRSILPLMREFLQNKINIFIFPEGKLAGTEVPLAEKFQSGVSEIVTKLVSKKDEVRVVPLGFAYNSGFKKNLASVYVGEPVVFKKSGDFFTSTKGNVDSRHARQMYKNFFYRENVEDVVITMRAPSVFDQPVTTYVSNLGRDSSESVVDRIPVSERIVPSYISGILCENLSICRKEAIMALPEKSLKENVFVV